MLDPIGLWLDEYPVANWVAAAPEEVPAMLFTDPDGEVARAAIALPEDPDAADRRHRRARLGDRLPRRSSSGRSPTRASRNGSIGSWPRR